GAFGSGWERGPEHRRCRPSLSTLDARGGAPRGGKAMRGRLAWWLLCVGALGSGCASTPGAGRVAGDSDDYFMLWASQMNLAEIAAGEMASERAVTDRGRDYGEELVQAPRRALQDIHRLAPMAGTEHATRPVAPGASQ